MSEENAVRRLMGFLFDYEQVRRPVGTFSGGERTRLALLLLMEDGRTASCSTSRRTTWTSLDRGARGRARAFDGTVVAVSHDRYFLDRIADRIVVVADGAAHAYEGGWSANLARV